MRVIGTAGHVDHGKSMLVEALTGTHPDRLKEERERAMTIDLGFAWFNLPGGEAVGVIDVPGHRDFIENMLAGVGGLDAVLFVIAADEGVMPQTREHLAIVDLLGIAGGVVALTKADLVEADWLDLISAEVREALRGTVLAQAPLVPVSARTGRGLPELQAALQTTLAARPPRLDRGRPQLPIDRVFSLTGFGTIVTGTLTEGSFAVGEAVTILPPDLPARVRGLQTHKTKLERAVPGSRVSLNLAGVEVSQLRRGMVVAHPGTLAATRLLDAQFRHLAEAEFPLKHNAQVKVFIGAAEALATVRLLGRVELKPGETGWIQLVCAEPVVATKGQRFILRRPSPGATLGGGVVVDPQPTRRHRQNDPAVVARLQRATQGTPAEILLQALEGLGPTSLAAALAQAGLTAAAAGEAVTELRQAGDLIELEGEALVAARAMARRFEADLQAALGAYHAQYPLRVGMPREELKSRLSQQQEARRLPTLTARAFNALVGRAAAAGTAVAQGAVVRLADHQIVFTPAQQARVAELLADFRAHPYETPLPKECAARVGEPVLAALIDLGQLVSVSPEVLFLAETYADMVAQVTAYLRARGQITVAEVRDLFQTSRKYALALMEHLDASGLTKRVGDGRVLKQIS